MLKEIVKKLYLRYYNRKHDTKIRSIYASTKAKYGRDVLIDYNTVVEENVDIGDYSYVNKNSYIENCTIGKYCSVSSGVFICPAEHTLSNISTHPFFEPENKKIQRKPVVIGNDVLISLNAIILEGVTVNNGAVIAAGAVVTKDVKPYEIVGGVPARHIGYRFTDEEIESIENTEWWNWDRSKIERNRRFFGSVSSFLKTDRDNA